MSSVTALFIGGPWDKKTRTVDYQPVLLVPDLSEVPASTYLHDLDTVDAKAPLLAESGTYEEDRRYASPDDVRDYVVYLWKGTRQDQAEARKAKRRKRLMGAFQNAWSAQYDHDREGYLRDVVDMTEALDVLDEALS